MKHKMFLIVAALVLLFLSASSIWAAEITIDWRQKLDSGRVDDLHFMPGQEQFILTSGQGQNFTEIRSCDDGSILHSYPFGGYQFEFTPDSTKLIFMCQPTPETGELQILNLADMNLLASYQPPKEEELPYSYYDGIAVDPARPLVYAIRTIRNNDLSNGIVKMKILIYNSETLQPVGELTSGVDSSLKFSEIAVSKDGKYLAAMNYGDSKLTVWSLDTRKKIVDKFISDQNTGKFSEPAYIKFSELNTDIIFFTGQFYRKNNEELTGLCIYSIKENRIIDSTFAIGVNSGIAHIAFFEYGKKILLGGYMIKVINLNDMRLEYQRIYNENNKIISATYPVYNEEKKFFLGYNPGGIINRFKYQPNTNVTSDDPKVVIYPNPTTNSINLDIDERFFNGNWQITDLTGQILRKGEIENNENFHLDISNLPAQTYFLRISNGKEYKVEKVMKW